ncbi:uncharacterized protein AB675_8430 [Cyphellophora attinorum]|uniref:Uncharacterized protein n=1 Tax=Cyphellophora attinorum TaxID=1664694 RepID=A0A0N1P0Z4_9EURO|nr:uncharacterized protein AB675_8430 [Phialophora attinorum]KPI44330.1 hypothetical protein AB675_8430 [Phialophora attinorum]
MISKRLTAIIRPASAGINTRGLPTINVSGTEIPVESYFRVLDLAGSGRGIDDIAADIIRGLNIEERASHTNYNALVQQILLNHELAHSKHSPVSADSSRTSMAVSRPKTRSSTMLKRVTTHASTSDPGLQSPTSPEKEETLLVAGALKLMTQRDAIGKSMPESIAKRRATAAIELQLRSSLQRHQAIDDAQMKQILWIRAKAASGCSKCIPCHFSEYFLRDLSSEHINSVLDGEFDATDLPSHGIQQVPLGRNMYREVADGVYHKTVSLHRKNVSSSRIRFFLQEKWNIRVTDSHIYAIVDHYHDSLPRNEVGQPDVPTHSDPAPHPGNRLTELPTEAVTPRLGRPRTSFSRPPPTYSPRPTWRGVELRHQREVVPSDGHMPPFYLASSAPQPPSYESPPPMYSDAVPHRPSNLSTVTSSDGYGAMIIDEPISPLALESFTRSQAPSPPARRESQVLPSTLTLPTTADDFSAAITLSDLSQGERNAIARVADELTFANFRLHFDRSTGDYRPALYSFAAHHSTGAAAASLDTEFDVKFSSHTACYRVSGGIARAILNEYPWRFRALTSAEAHAADAEITRFTNVLPATPLADLRLPTPHPALLALKELDPVLRGMTIQTISTMADEMNLPSCQSPTSDAALHREQEASFVFSALQAMLSKDHVTRAILGAKLTTDNDNDRCLTLRDALCTIEHRHILDAVDRRLEEWATMIRWELAAMLGIDLANVLPPYTLANFFTELAAGTFVQDQAFTVDEDELEEFLASLPEELEIFTEESSVPPFISAGAAPALDELQTRSWIPNRTRRYPERHDVTNVLCHNIAVEILQTPQDDHELATAIRAIVNMPVRQDIAANEWTLQRLFIQMSHQREVLVRDLPMIIEASRHPTSALRVDTDIPTPTAANDDSHSEASTPTWAHIDLPSPLPTECTAVDDPVEQVKAITIQYPFMGPQVLSHFPADTVWTPALLDALPALLLFANNDLIAQLRTVIEMLEEKIMELGILSRRSVQDRAVSPARHMRLKRKITRAVDKLRKMAVVLRDVLSFVLASMRERFFARHEQRGSNPEATIALVEESTSDDQQAFADGHLWTLRRHEREGLQMFIDDAILMLRIVGVGRRSTLGPLGLLRSDSEDQMTRCLLYAAHAPSITRDSDQMAWAWEVVMVGAEADDRCRVGEPARRARPVWLLQLWGVQRAVAGRYNMTWTDDGDRYGPLAEPERLLVDGDSDSDNGSAIDDDDSDDLEEGEIRELDLESDDANTGPPCPLCGDNWLGCEHFDVDRVGDIPYLSDDDEEDDEEGVRLVAHEDDSDRGQGLRIRGAASRVHANPRDALQWTDEDEVMRDVHAP